jgi:hypothetical protein
MLPNFGNIHSFDLVNFTFLKSIQVFHLTELPEESSCIKTACALSCFGQWRMPVHRETINSELNFIFLTDKLALCELIINNVVFNQLI